MSIDSPLRTRRSIRHFSTTQLERAAIEAILADAAWAPSGGNAQPWSVTALSPTRTRALLDRYERRIWSVVVARVVAMQRRAAPDLELPALLRGALDRIDAEGIVTGAPWLLLVWSHHERIDDDILDVVRTELAARSPAALLPTAEQLRRVTEVVDPGVTEASVASFVYAITLAAHMRAAASCIQHGWLLFADELAAEHPPSRPGRLAAAVLIGAPSATDTVDARAVERRPVSVAWG